MQFAFFFFFNISTVHDSSRNVAKRELNIVILCPPLCIFPLVDVLVIGWWVECCILIVQFLGLLHPLH